MDRQECAKLSHCVYALNYHLVLVTKYRRQCISPAITERLREIVAYLCDCWGGRLVEFNGTTDHAHLLVSLPPNLRLGVFVNNIKTVTARRIRKEFAKELAGVYSKPIFWSRTYCILTCGGAPLETIKKYIENQNNWK